MFKQPVVFVDIETTGMSYKNSRVLEVAAIRYEKGVITNEFSSLINPGSRVPSVITSITGISDNDITHAPTFNEIAEQLKNLFDDALFIAHNVKFDHSFLKQEFADLGVKFSPKLLCTVRLSRALYPHHKGHSLAALIERHNIPVQARHRALDDTKAILYFSQLAHQEHGQEAFDAAIAKQLKTQYMPPNIAAEELSTIKNEPGVYVFEDEQHNPIYIGKSITLKKRVLSHFQDSSSKELKIGQNVHYVRTIPTGDELSALLLESKLVKQLMPLFNRRLRRISSYALLIKSMRNSYATITIENGNLNNDSDLRAIYGLYESRTKAKKRLEDSTRMFDLCPKLMGLEKSAGACFSYGLKRCKGACIGEESPTSYNSRFEIALQHAKFESWPYQSAITIPMNEEKGVVIDNWMIQGFYELNDIATLESVEPNFDVDEYKIIRRFIRENKHAVQPFIKA